MADSLDTTNLSRRAMLSGIPAAAIGIGALTLPALAGQSHEIAKLLEIERQIIIHRDAVEAQQATSDRISREIRRDKRKMTIPRYYYANDPNGVRSQYDFARRSDRYDARCRRIKEESGFNASEARLSQLRDAQTDLALSVWEVKATSLEALKIKARIAKISPWASASVLSDLLEI